MLNFTLRKFEGIGLKIITMSLMLLIFSSSSFSQVTQTDLSKLPTKNKIAVGVSDAELLKAKVLAAATMQKFPSDAKGNSLGPAPTSITNTSRISNVFPEMNPDSRAFIYNGAAATTQLRKHALPTPATLTAVGATVVFGFPGAMAVNPRSNLLYVVNQAAPFQLYVVDSLSGTRIFLTNLTGVPQANLTGITFDSATNVMYGLSSSITVSQIFTINIGTGACTPIGTPSALVAGGIQLNAAPGGSLFTVDIVTDALYKWNKTTGVPTLVGPLGVDANFGQDGHFDNSDGAYYWAAIGGTLPAQLRVIDTTNGSSTQVGLYPVQSATLGIFSKPAVACSGTPAPGNTLSTSASVCPGTPFLLSLQNSTAGTGVTYQWQSSPTLTGTYTSIPGATNYTYVVNSLTATTFYQAIVTCGAQSGTSTPVQVNLNPVTACYCTPNTTNCNLDDQIQQVIFGGINNTSTCSANGYGNFTNLAPGLAIAGGANPIQVKVGPGGTEFVVAWIDYNKNGVFEASEYSTIGSGNGVTISGVINVPANAPTGITRMRIRVRFATNPGTGEACTTTGGFGEVEDYNVDIQPCVPITVTTQPTDKSIVCGNSTFFKVVAAGSLPTYQWQFRTTATGVWQVVPNAAPYSGVTTDSLSITSATAALNGYQYRALISGACAAANPSNPATLTVTPVIAIVTPASATICNGSIQQLSLTNTVSAPVTSTFNATTVPVAIPDATPSPIVSTTVPMVVSGIPAGSIITNIGVRFTMTHTFVGDIIMNLKAPNGQQLSLINQLNGGLGTNATDDFTNTVLDSTATLIISGAAAPRTGTYRAEKFLINNPVFGDLQTTNVSWAGLLSTLNGTWSLQIADPFGGDEGLLTAAQIFITYTAPSFAQGTWAGPAGTIFTDAAATTAYTGTPATTVYVRPTANGVNNYTVSFVSGACTSSTATIPVTVRQLPTSLGAVTSQSVCTGGNATFTSTVVGGSGFALQWQLSTDGGNTYANLANAGIYSGVTTNTLTVSGVTVTMNNYLYRLTTSAAPCVGTPATTASAAGTLTVFPTPVVVLGASPYTALFPGITTTLTASVSSGTPSTYVWTYNGSVLAGATGNTVSNLGVNNLGTYSVRVTTTNGCVGTSNTITLRDSSTNNLFIYPNPNNGSFQVRFFNTPDNPFSGTPRSVVVYDSKGSRVYSQATIITPGTYGAMNINLVNQPAGVYHVDLVDGRGNRLKTGKVVIL